MEISRDELSDGVIPEGATALVETALTESEFMFRSPQGIEEETGVPAPTVEEILDLSPHVRKSVLKDHEGKTLYAALDQPKTLRERAETVFQVLAMNARATRW